MTLFTCCIFRKYI